LITLREFQLLLTRAKFDESLQKYFEAIPGTPLCLENQSPVNYAISVIGDGVNEVKSLRDYAFEFRVSELALQTHIEMQQLRRGKGEWGPDLVESGYRAPFPLMAKEVLLKMQRFYWRNVNYNFGRMTSALGLGLILGSVYFNITPDTNVKMNVKSQSLFIVCVLLGVTNASNVIPQILTMSATLERETNTNQYNVLLYNIGWTLGEVNFLFSPLFLSLSLSLSQSSLIFYPNMQISFLNQDLGY
jgi:hypothetical protein